MTTGAPRPATSGATARPAAPHTAEPSELSAEQPARSRPQPPWQGQWPVVGAVALGGGIGAALRYGATLLWPTAPGTFPTTVFLVNVVGCALMGVLMALITERGTPHPLLRPFLGTGVLGGFTTFSTYTADIRHLTDTGRLAVGLAYLAATLLAALAAVWAAHAGTRYALTRRGGAR
ncbi:fluoride efflux transporter CrcB [Streptomyces paromomycinus]|uniref:Fluoride-specific ion channel FluC n=1 Tax=Streptomyces paromomycinus TaxID=92743 RepID=A0A401W1B7_STREY|nr:fluoride efflux transporter CrcB [Streptomyces paromomycinus]GCD43096.1 putative fluoride ion transporter CrcB [Streptomyces paromomycinus]